MKLNRILLLVSCVALLPQMASAMGAGYGAGYDPYASRQRASQQRASRRVDADEVISNFKEVNTQVLGYKNHIADLDKKVKALDRKKDTSWKDAAYIRNLKAVHGEINNVVEMEKGLRESISVNFRDLGTLHTQEPERKHISSRITALMKMENELLPQLHEQVIEILQHFVRVVRGVNTKRGHAGLPSIDLSPKSLPSPTGAAIGAQKGVEAGIIAAITAAIVTYIGRRRYQNKKKALIKKYALGSLTPLQNSIWRATALASMRIPRFLQSLVRNKAGSLTDFVGPDSRAVAELYYGHMPSKQEVQSFLSRFFEGVQ